MAGTIVVNKIKADPSYSAPIDIESKVNFTAGIQVNGINTSIGPGIMPFRNKIRNADLNVNQRGNNIIHIDRTTYPSNTNLSVYWVDGFITPSLMNNSTANLRVEISTDVPFGSGVNKSIKTTVVTGNSQPVGISEDQAILALRTESYYLEDTDWGTSEAKPLTLSFWVKSSLVGKYSLFINQPNLTGGTGTWSQLKEFTINSANTWEYKTILIEADTVNSLPANLSLEGLRIEWRISCGSNYVAPATTTWQDLPDKRAVTGTVDLFSNTNATFYLAAIQLELGSSASTFDKIPYNYQLMWCQRYFLRFDKDTMGQSVIGVTGDEANIYTYWFPVSMRVAPSFLARGSWVTYTFPSAGAVRANNELNTTSTALLGETSTLGGRFRHALFGQAGLICWADFVSRTIKIDFSAEI